MSFNRQAQLVVGTTAVLVITACLALKATWRVHMAHRFGEPHAVATYGGTNYVVALDETTVGRTATGYVLIVYLRVQNPNAHELTLDRDWFVLADHNREYFQPSTTGTQTRLIKVPSQGVSESEMLSFTLGEDGLGGGLALKIGKDAWVLLKSTNPYAEQLRPGELRSYHRGNW